MAEHQRRKTLTNHIATFHVTMVNLKRCCLHTDQTPPTEREQVLKLLASIITAEPLLIAHISQVNADLGGLGANSPCKADPDIWMRKAKRADNTQLLGTYASKCR